MRNIKTAIAVVISLYLSDLFNLGNPLFVIIGAIVSMQVSLNETYVSGINRILGTILGALLGIVFYLLAPGNIFLIGIGIVLLISLNNHLNWNKSLVISLIVFCSLMINYNNENIFSSSLKRVSDTTLGIIVAFIVNTLIAPPKHDEMIFILIQDIQDKLYQEFYKYLMYDSEFIIKDIQEDIVKLNQTYDLYKKEFLINEKKDIQEDEIIRSIMLIEEIYNSVSVINSLDKQISRTNSKFIKRYLNIDVDFSDESESDEYRAYNFHIKIIVNDMLKLKKIKAYNL